VSQGTSHVNNVLTVDAIQLKIHSRLIELKEEYAKGQLRLLRTQDELTGLQQMMLRLSGAITVLEELLKPDTAGGT
jgi:hypothetical protein